MPPLVAIKPLKHHKSNLNLTAEQRLQCDEMEQWKFLSVQIWIQNVGSFLIAFFELLVFFIAIFSMDFTRHSPNWIKNFGFMCKDGTDSIWWIHRSNSSGTLWELHIIICFLYTTLVIIILSTVPYKYDRFIKTKKEMRAEKKKARKKQKKAKKAKSALVDIAKPDYNLLQSSESHLTN